MVYKKDLCLGQIIRKAMDPDYSVKGIIIIELSIFANFIKQNEVCYSNTICGLLCRKWHNKKAIMS